MKVGTDGVLLGAWTKPINSKTFLDVGSGTGLISLMLAQRFEKATIYSIEINLDAASECSLNFDQSKWRDRLHSIHNSFLNYNPDIKFDLIISNPPYFSQTTKPISEKRTLARHDDSLSLKNLIFTSEKILNKNGIIALIIPYSDMFKIKSIVENSNLYFKRICLVRGVKNNPIKRMLVELTKNQLEVIKENLVIENSRHKYTEDYKNLCKKFYLHL